MGVADGVVGAGEAVDVVGTAGAVGVTGAAGVTGELGRVDATGAVEATRAVEAAGVVEAAGAVEAAGVDMLPLNKARKFALGSVAAGALFLWEGLFALRRLVCGTLGAFLNDWLT